MLKRAQTSIFIIIAAIFILFFSVFISLHNKDEVVDVEMANSQVVLQSDNNDFIQIKQSFQDCFDNALSYAVYMSALQGGYYDTDSLNTAEYYDLFIPYYIEDGSASVPSVEIIEKEMNYYFNDEVMFCIENKVFDLEELGYNVTYSDVESDIFVKSESISANVNFEVSLYFVGEAVVYDKFRSEYDYDFLSKYMFALNFVKYWEDKKFNGVPVSYLTMYAYENEFMYDYYGYGDGKVVLVFTFDDGPSEPLVYFFAVDYSQFADGGEV